ncbi:hypothetical protein BM221_008048 [Beauveria bassiana]|uniref:Uncharacterized protein n=1 Tax=Beauveria bassiana TaxID=176275 RepID=A0A2N6NF13_BEABA|nr:hypothetical protein BM221_008048 [Beauveria bassiana]
MEHIDHTVVKMLWEMASITDRRLSILSLEYSIYKNFIIYPSLVAETAPSISFLYWPSLADEVYPPGNNCLKTIGVFIQLSNSGDNDIGLRRDLLDVFAQVGSMGSLEELWLDAYTKIKSHASATPEEAGSLQFVLSNLAAACRRLHYVKIDRLAWRIHPKVRHTKQQVCTFEEIDAWEAAAEGPVAFLGPNPFDHDVLHEDWW